MPGGLDPEAFSRHLERLDERQEWCRGIRVQEARRLIAVCLADAEAYEEFVNLLGYVQGDFEAFPSFSPKIILLRFLADIGSNRDEFRELMGMHFPRIDIDFGPFGRRERPGEPGWN